MCGIAGQVRRDKSVDAELIERMCAAIAHRGPDAHGRFVAGGVGLGIQRLRVIDLETGDQPIFNEDGSICVVLNGEIYNYRELRRRLGAAGHRFATNADTEVIVHLYEDLGIDCVRWLHGMFALALWDGRRRQLLLARDRVGKKPLFYAHRDHALSFASELQGLLEDGEIGRDIDYSAFDCCTTYGYVPAPLTAFRAIRKLPPASTLVLRDGRVTIDRYWKLDYAQKREHQSPSELREEIRGAIENAVRQRLVADVPVGAFLSGGVDSSAVVAAMARVGTGSVKTFSVGFDREGFDELPHARRVAELFSTDHHEFVVKPSAIEILPALVRHYGEPFADASAIPTFYLAGLTREHVTVALNGDGGDESFAGYNRYVANATAARFDTIPLRLRRICAGVGERIPPDRDPTSARNRLRRLARSIAASPVDRYITYVSWSDQALRDRLYTPEYKALIADSSPDRVISEPWSRASGASVVDVMLECDVETYLPGDLLTKMDIATMAHSLEARSPLLDVDLMELAASIPADLKLRRLDKKLILRDAVAEWLPRDLLDRPKRGFEVPLAHWFRGELKPYVEEVLLDPLTTGRGYFDATFVTRLIDEHVGGREDHSLRLWTLLFGELWHRQFIDRGPRASPLSIPVAERLA